MRAFFMRRPCPHGSHELREVGGGKGGVRNQYIRRDADQGDGRERLAQGVAVELFVSGDLRHDEIRLAEHHALGVDADKDLGDRLDIQIRRQLNQADLLLGDVAQPVQALENQIFFHIRI